ncbi:MAG: hypothetical protein Ct9H300mP13_2300 [Gammaproteobacteria bacterium]|nr:MAG: hypothetical protein Ct9H300mP13_2300 [Gammaproteobacteria bacterium]
MHSIRNFGRPDLVSTSHAALLEISDLKVEFPTRRGTLVAVNGVTFNIKPRRGAWFGW